jgi:hypothetical protein
MSGATLGSIGTYCGNNTSKNSNADLQELWHMYQATVDHSRFLDRVHLVLAF